MAVKKTTWLAGALMLVVPAAVAAQPASPATTWTRGTTLNLFGGVASASSDAGALVGGGVGWEIAPHFGIEGTVSWLDRPGDAEAFAAGLTAHAALTGTRPVVPFLKGGIGLYRATIGPSLTDVPEFYRRRLDAGSSLAGSSRTFTDPAFLVGGGVDVFTSRHLAIRPEIEAMIVRRQSQSHVVTAVRVHLAYHVEEHPVTPALGPSRR